METTHKKAMESPAALALFIELEKQMKRFDTLVEEKLLERMEKENKKIQAVREDAGALSEQDVRKKGKRDEKFARNGMLGGVMLGVLAAAAICLSPPAGLAITSFLVQSGGIAIGSTAALAATSAGVVAASTAAGNGVGKLIAGTTPFIPVISAEKKEALREEARQEAYMDIARNIISVARLQRMDGVFTPAQLADALEALQDIAVLKYKLPQEAASRVEAEAAKARQKADNEAERILKEKQQAQEEVKHQKTEARETRREQQEEVREKLGLRQIRQEMELKRLAAEMQLRKPAESNDALSGVLTSLLGGEGNFDLGTLAAMRMMFGKNGSAAKAAI